MKFNANKENLGHCQMPARKISKQISYRIGFPQNYIEDLTDDLVSILKRAPIKRLKY